MIGSMNCQFILYRAEQQVGWVSLNRPEVLNSFNRQMALELQQVFAAIENDAEVRAVLLSGEGRAFCAGQDLSDVTGSLGAIVRESYNPIIRAIRRLKKPVVCFVNGIAAGAGANLALACDFVIASEKAAFVQSFCKVGLIPDSGGTFILPRLVGLARATALMMLGEKVSAQQAFDIGMIHKVGDDTEARKLALHLASQPTTGLGLIKEALNAGLDAQLDLEAALQERAGLTSDYQEGIRAFLEKRPPKFMGR
jgi:2-(1,2-epoxy-1,2-dihydrophenyl)acetyl-CoA isomerase